MLEWTLDNNTSDTSMVHGQHVPASIQAMTTTAPDEFGNPAGSPARIGRQVSAKKRSVIENFEDGTWSIASQTPMVVTQVVDEGDLAGGTMNVRHAGSGSLGGRSTTPGTLNIPLTAFSGINKNAVEAVYLAFPAGSQGTLLIDSVGWFKP